MDCADAKTGKPFSIRIQQAKPIFTYLICDSEKAKQDWMKDLRIAAGGYEVRKKRVGGWCECVQTACA